MSTRKLKYNTCHILYEKEERCDNSYAQQFSITRTNIHLDLEIKRIKFLIFYFYLSLPFTLKDLKRINEQEWQ